jgi:hypothetical protein
MSTMSRSDISANAAWKASLPPPIDAGLQRALPGQIALVEESHILMSAWMKRRQEALQTGLQAFQEMAASPDPATMTKACIEWVNGSVNRVLSDVSDTHDRSLRIIELNRKTWQAMFSAEGAAAMPAPAAAAEPLASPVEAAEPVAPPAEPVTPSTEPSETAGSPLRTARNRRLLAGEASSDRGRPAPVRPNSDPAH